MLSAITKIIKFFELEIDRNFDNRSVFGGLGNFSQSWKNEASEQAVSQDIVSQVFDNLEKYPAMEKEQRADAIHRLLPLLQTENKNLNPKSFNSTLKNNPINSKAANPKHSGLANKEFSLKDELTYPIKENCLTYQIQNNKIQGEELERVLNSPVINLSSIGETRAKTLAEIGIETLRDVIFHFPRKYDDYSQLKTINKLKYKEKVTVLAIIKSAHTRPSKNGKVKITEVIVEDGTGSLRITFFNQPFLEKKLAPGIEILLSGTTDMYLGRFVMNNPEWELAENDPIYESGIIPSYRSTQNFSQKQIRKSISQAISFWAGRLPECYPNRMLEEAELMNFSQALYEIHIPSSMENLKKARERLSFDEIFFLQLEVLQQKKNWQSDTAIKYGVDEQFISKLEQNISFELTSAQKRSIADIRNDFERGIPMSRLIQGDVGSGKTMVAAFGIAITAANGFQTALMAPTSILAEQHYKNILKFFETNQLLSPKKIRLLVGDTSESEKEDIRRGLENGNIFVIIGTHALIEAPIQFKALQLVIIDEQHRFGVEQRKKLREKGRTPHLLAMSATPIPRSLALTIYGDMDLSVINEMPPGRQPVETYIVTPLDRERIYQIVLKQIESGRQVFFIFPLVESDDEDPEKEAKSAVNQHVHLKQKVFPQFEIGLLHGRMRPDEKEEVMRGFRDQKYQILVSTTVVEVGVDIPNASVMVIEGANRFGLAQLHQLRGRVGRGMHKSYCLLIPENEDALENQRLLAMSESNDGFVLAEKDLEQRGPGNFLGTDQSGFGDLRLANIMNTRLIEKARSFAEKAFQSEDNIPIFENSDMQTLYRHNWKEPIGDNQ
ncbi:MAG: DNA helicase RecG [Chloroflexi bacterium HGW-Chloroflexi-10]|nr:MAG: DNA helicase RecG [Chloroflexi bacterium HGW-Chloroflexi-10]